MKEERGKAASWGFGLAFAMAIALVLGAMPLVSANDDGTTPAKKKLTGEQLFAMHCSRCHAERYPTESSKVQWKTLLLHMQVRGHLPAEQARAIYKYMLENK